MFKGAVYTIILSLGLISVTAHAGKSIMNAVVARHASGPRVVTNAVAARHVSGPKQIANSIIARHVSGPKVITNAVNTRHSKGSLNRKIASGYVLNLNQDLSVCL